MSGITVCVLTKNAGEAASSAAATTSRRIEKNAEMAATANSSVSTCREISLQPKIAAQIAMAAGASGGFARMSNAGRDVPVQLNVKPYGSSGARAICFELP